MKERILWLFLLINFLTPSISVFSQSMSNAVRSDGPAMDSLRSSGTIFNNNQNKPDIKLTVSQAVKFLQQRYQVQYWNNSSDPFRMALGQLIFHASNPLFDSSEYILKKFPYDSLNVPWDEFYIWEPLRLKIPDSGTQGQPQDGVKRDTNLIPGVTDSLGVKLEKAKIQGKSNKSLAAMKDTTIMVIIDTLHEVTSSYSGSPFRYFSYPYQADSIKVAVNELLKYLEDRDSTIINFTGIGNVVTPVWINSKSDRMARYWLKNELSDSVTVWIGNTSRDTIGLYLEKGVTFRRPVKQGNYSDARINIKSLDNSKLHEVQKIYIKPRYWKYRSEAAFIMSQAALSNWVKGGENSFSTSADVTGYADYANKVLKVSSSNFVRLKVGFLKSGSNPVRKNLDLIETNSKLNHKAFGKFDFSGILLFKTQIAPGKDYNTDPATVVSKFMNPAILTIGFGLDYKPNKVTSLNFSPLSYKGTFVTDTANIDQTKYGIPRDKKSLNEPGVSFMITHEFKPYKSVTITNRLQLFTNYVHNPQNIDVDWEMIAVANLNWFTDVRLNTHLIFDDDTKSLVLKNKVPVLRPDGTQKKTARAQFKELLGLSFVFKF
jgi:hypothetical protein